MHLLVAVGEETRHVVVVLAPTHKADSKGEQRGRGWSGIVASLADKFSTGQPSQLRCVSYSHRRKAVQCFPFKVFYDEARWILSAGQTRIYPLGRNGARVFILGFVAFPFPYSHSPTFHSFARLFTFANETSSGRKTKGYL